MAPCAHPAPGAPQGVFVVGVLLGFGGTTCLVTAVTMEAELVDQHKSSCAFVYGLLSLTDKLSNGLLIVLIQLRRQTILDSQVCGAAPSEAACLPLSDFTRQVVAMGCGGSALLGAAAAWATFTIRRRNALRDAQRRQPLLEPLTSGEASGSGM